MKFIPHQDAPNIPLEVIEAQESDNLVIFCGAGISVPSGLPSFSGLVKDVYKALATTPNELEQEELDRWAYDSVLGLLENRIDKDNSQISKVRQKIIERLIIEDGADLSTHEAILQLSKTSNQNYRLVTTNIDHGFLICNSELTIDKAPNLPVPKPHKWESLVHIHGIIDDKDPNGRHIVFTSADFGTAYLTEGWASRFVTELFRNYTVLFIGYSIDDPVLRYMTDAIAAERRNEKTNFKESYVIARQENESHAKDIAKWEAKGVIPILFKNDFDHLHNTLKAWANHSKDGLNGKAHIIQSQAIHPPLPPYDQIESLTLVIDTLKEKSSPNNDSITGFPAKVFAELEPPAPIEWLPVLHENNLLSLHDNNIRLLPSLKYQANLSFAAPNKITYHLWRWMSKHLESDDLINWLYENGLFLHPELKRLISLEIKRNTPKEPYLKFWNTLISAKFIDGGNDTLTFYNNLDLLKEGQYFATDGLISLFNPGIKLQKPYGWPARKVDPFTGKELKPFTANIDVQISEHEYKTLSEQQSFFSTYEAHLSTVTGYLKSALDTAKLYGLASDDFDNSHWSLPSIEPHPQNNYNDNWTLIIELCRDFLAEAIKENSPIAQATVELWRSYKYPAFRRLVLHAMTISDLYEVTESLNYLLEDNGAWLNDSSIAREKYRLLNKLWPDLSNNLSNKLIEIILNGPDKKDYQENIEANEWQIRVDRFIWLHLSKLNSFGKSLPQKAQEKLNKLSIAYPEWKLQDSNKDEFSIWTGSVEDRETESDFEELFSLDAEAIVKQLMEGDKGNKSEYLKPFALGASENIDKVLDVLGYLNENNIRSQHIWHEALYALAEISDDVTEKILDLILENKSDLFINEQWVISWWLKKNILRLSPEASPKFLNVANLLLNNIKKQESDFKEPITAAINSPEGMLAEAILLKIGDEKLSAGQTLPRNENFQLIEKIINADNEDLILAKLIIFSRLQYLFAVDPAWANERVIPLLDIQEHAATLWQGYLWNPRINVDSALALKDKYIKQFASASSLGKAEKYFMQLLPFCYLEFPNLFDDEEVSKLFSCISIKQLEFIASFIESHFRENKKDSTEKEKIEYWKNRVKPFITQFWPQSDEYKSEDVSSSFALIAVSLETNFSEVVSFIKPYLTTISSLHRVLYNLNETNICEKQPSDVIELLSFIFIENTQGYSNNEQLRNTVSKLCSVDENLCDNPILVRINNYLTLSQY